MKILGVALLAALTSLKASASDMGELTNQFTSASSELRGYESGQVELQLQSDFKEAASNFITKSPLDQTSTFCKSLFSHFGTAHGLRIFEWVDGKDIVTMAQALTYGLDHDYRLIFMKNMRRNLFSLCATSTFGETARALRSYVYVPFPKTWLEGVFYPDFNFREMHLVLQTFFKKNRQGCNCTKIREDLLDHLLTTRSGLQSLGLFFETLDFQQKEQFLKRSLFNAKRLRGFEGNTDIFSDFPKLQRKVIQHNAWLDLTSEMAGSELYTYVWCLGRKQKRQKFFAYHMLLQDRAGMSLDEFVSILYNLQDRFDPKGNDLLDLGQRRELLLSVARDSTGNVDQQAYAMRLYITNEYRFLQELHGEQAYRYAQRSGPELREEEKALTRHICESIVQDPEADPKRQLYAVQRLIDLDPVAQTLFKIQTIADRLYYKYRWDTSVPTRIKAQIDTALKKVLVSFQKTDIEDLYRVLEQDLETDYKVELKNILLKFDAFSQKQTAQTSKGHEISTRLALQEFSPKAELKNILLKFDTFSQEQIEQTHLRAELRVRLVLQGVSPLKELMQWELHQNFFITNPLWKLRMVKDLAPFNVFGAKDLLLEFAQDPINVSQVWVVSHVAFLLRRLNCLEDARKVYTYMMNNPDKYEGIYARNWLKAHDAVTFLKASGSLSELENLEITFLFDVLEPGDEIILWDAILLHTHSQAQKQTARDEIKFLEAQKKA